MDPGSNVPTISPASCPPEAPKWLLSVTGYGWYSREAELEVLGTGEQEKPRRMGPDRLGDPWKNFAT